MSCLNNNCYLPQPPRAWSRVQNSCSVITDTDNNSLVIDPYTGQLIQRIVLAERIDMLNKGNVLQYKANSSNLTQAQKYSKIAKGQWVNRNTTWATQSTRGYTNPNTTSLKRTGNVVNIAIDPITGSVTGPTVEPPTCPQLVTPINEGLPSNEGGGSIINDPVIPPPVPPTPGSDTFPDIIEDIPAEPVVIQDGGILICSVQENICTGETKSTLGQQCHPTTDSDVPGTIRELCWNDGTQTWYPRQRYVMTNSDNKWPVNAELLGSIQIYPPYITSITSNNNIITITWTFNDACLPASNFNIYQDRVLIQTVLGNIYTTEINVNNFNNYKYYIIAENITAKATSEKSNTVFYQRTLTWTWTVRATSLGTLNWSSIASSSDGTKLAATEYPGYIYTSTDSGVSWTQQNSGGLAWTSIASSSDGTKLAAVVANGYIYTSTDAGVNWTARATSFGFQYWRSIASSNDGTKLAAIVSVGYLYTSTDSGVTWIEQTNNAGYRNWSFIASSSDGTKLAATIFPGSTIYTSTDSGVNWIEQNISAGALNWTGIASSSDGTYLAAVAYGGSIYTSTNSGVNWTAQNSGSKNWTYIASSSDGTFLAATVSGGYIYTSTDAGVNWTQQNTSAGYQNWSSIASSSDGTYLAATVLDGYIYTANLSQS